MEYLFKLWCLGYTGNPEDINEIIKYLKDTWGIDIDERPKEIRVSFKTLPLRYWYCFPNKKLTFKFLNEEILDSFFYSRNGIPEGPRKMDKTRGWT